MYFFNIERLGNIFMHIYTYIFFYMTIFYICLGT